MSTEIVLAPGEETTIWPGEIPWLSPPTVLDWQGYHITTGWVLLTDELSHRLLQTNVENRNLVLTHTAKLEHDLRAGQMPVSHQGIAIDEDGHQADGQHREWACIRSGVSFPILITLGIPREAKKRVDTGRRRNAVTFESGRYKTARGAAARILVAIRALDGRLSINTLTREMARATDADVQNLMSETNTVGEMLSEWATRCQSATQATPGIGAGSMLAACATYPDSAWSFTEGIINGSFKGDPRFAITRIVAGSRLQTPEAAFICLKMMRAFTRKTEVRGVRWTRTELLVVPCIEPQQG